jgi:hypothetical protein
MRRSAVLALVLVVGLGAGGLLVGCTSVPDGGFGTTTTVAPTIDVTTPAGVVTVSLDAQLPSGWPAEFPVPSTATPAGTGVLPGAAPTTKIGAFSSSATPDEVFGFYSEQAGLPVASATSAGDGDTFDGTVRIEGDPAGVVTVVGRDGGAMVVAVLQGDGAG